MAGLDMARNLGKATHYLCQIRTEYKLSMCQVYTPVVDETLPLLQILKFSNHFNHLIMQPILKKKF